MINNQPVTIKGPAIRYHGGKYRLAPWIMSFFPPHQCYVEAFGGAASVLLQKQRCYAEVYNDLDGDIVNFFRILRDPETRQQLIEQLAHTPYARDEFIAAYEPTSDNIEAARRVAIRAQMGFGSAGATKGTTGFRIDTRRSYGTSHHLWSRYPEHIAIVGQRFESVLIENKNAIDVMKYHDDTTTLHYVDPPYVMSTRQIGHRDGCYRHEMDNLQHIDLLTALKQLAGMVILSGYQTELYQDMLIGWTVYTTPSRAAGQRGTKLTEEVVWINPACQSALDNDQQLFGGYV